LPSQNDFSFAVIDFTNPATPGVKLIQPPFNNNCIVDCDGTFAAAGEFNGSHVVIYDISNPAAPAQKGSVNTALGGISGLSVNGTRVLAGENEWIAGCAH
jgi:hypothetical protein